MAEINKMDRTWLCSVLFMDIANYSSQSVDMQMKWKQRFNAYLAEAIKDVPESDRVILDTGDGAAVCFLGAPEVAMFTALELCRSFAVDERDHQPGLRVRLGINLGPVKLVKDINGALNAIGDGINAGQRIMSFASANQILVSQSFYEVVSRLSDDYKLLFQLKGIETDKHVREHTVYHLTPPGSEKRESTVDNADGHAISAPPQAAASAPAAPSAAATPGAAARQSVVAAPEARAPKGQWIPWLIAGIALAAVAAVGVWHFTGSSAPAAPAVVNAPPPAQVPASTASPEPATTTASPAPVASKSAAPPAETPVRPAPPPAAKAAPETSNPVANTPAPSSPREAKMERRAERKEAATAPAPSGAPASASSAPPSSDAKTAYEDGMRLIDEDKAAEAARRFDDAIRAQPDYVDAYVGRAEARRLLEQWELSMADCNKIIQIKADDPRGYNCRGFARQMLKRLEPALADYNEAIRLNPNFVIAYEHRGTTYELLAQYDRAVEDYSQAIRLTPRNPMFYIRRGIAYSDLKQYDKAIRDYTEAIRLQPNNGNAHRLRALAEEASGDPAGAAADRAQMKELPKKKLK